ncbi:MAG: TetR/AcrR family transcriptional regulator [Rubrivivax sp.]|nr:TetR/AcrR family transcriptional regulator [Rubrivivax sp.]
MGRPRAATYDDQRAQILLAAAGLFAHRGYTATTMNAVAEASGISKATLYHYFADKHQLLSHIANDHVQRLEALVLQVRAQHRDPPGHLRELILQFMSAYAGAEHAHRVLTEDVKFLAPLTRQAVEDGQRRVVQTYADAVAAVRPDLAPGLHKPLAMLLFGMINWTFTWLRPQGELTHERLAPLVVELFLGGLVALRDPPKA